MRPVETLTLASQPFRRGDEDAAAAVRAALAGAVADELAERGWAAGDVVVHTWLDDANGDLFIRNETRVVVEVRWVPPSGG